MLFASHCTYFDLTKYVRSNEACNNIYENVNSCTIFSFSLSVSLYLRFSSFHLFCITFRSNEIFLIRFIFYPFSQRFTYVCLILRIPWGRIPTVCSILLMCGMNVLVCAAAVYDLPCVSVPVWLCLKSGNL